MNLPYISGDDRDDIQRAKDNGIRHEVIASPHESGSGLRPLGGRSCAGGALMGNVIKFEDLDIPALTEAAKESFEEALWATEKALAKQLEFGRVMLIVKSKLPYGEWGKWVRETFEDQMSLRNIQFHMKAHQEVAKNPSLLECANSLDEILTLTEKPRKPSVEVIEVAADEPHDVAAEVAAECGVTREQIIRDGEYAEAIDIVSQVDPDIRSKVRSGKVTQDEVIAAAKVAKPAKATSTNAEPEAERKSPSITAIERSLFKMGRDKRRHHQLAQIARLALSQLSADERCSFMTNELRLLTVEQRGQLIQSLRK
jgi:hypothetical protein